jgi:hypothetical protein
VSFLSYLLRGQIAISLSDICILWEGHAVKPRGMERWRSINFDHEKTRVRIQVAPLSKWNNGNMPLRQFIIWCHLINKHHKWPHLDWSLAWNSGMGMHMNMNTAAYINHYVKFLNKQSSFKLLQFIRIKAFHEQWGNLHYAIMCVVLLKLWRMVSHLLEGVLILGVCILFCVCVKSGHSNTGTRKNSTSSRDTPRLRKKQIHTNRK